MRIATWNVNSINARLPNVLAWLEKSRPDVLLLQETKCVADGFPRMEFAALGYEIAVAGQKGYNGVAILSLHPMTEIMDRLPGDESDEQARYIEATIRSVRIASIYLPNGNPVDANSEKYPYKLAWMRRLNEQARRLMDAEIPVVLGGDYNVIPSDDDVYDPKIWENDALFLPQTRAAFREIINQGYTEAFRALHPHDKHAYSFWDYQGGAWQRDNGIRIDHFLLSPEAADRLASCRIDREPRGLEKASDHTPMVMELMEP